MERRSCKCAPPIRSRENRERLWQGLRDGVIDLVVTDHSPCPPAMKRLDEGNFRTAWGGISSLSVALPVMWTEASSRGFTLLDIARWMAEEPARLAGCPARKGRIAPGFDADFVVFDPDGEFVVTEERLHYRHPLSPYMGETLRGVVKATYLRGKAVFSEGEFPGEPSGREFRAMHFCKPKVIELVVYTIPSARKRGLRLGTNVEIMNHERIVGTAVPRKEGREKVTGEARYVDDMLLAGYALWRDGSQPDSARQNQKDHVQPGHRVERVCDRICEGYSREELHCAHRRRSTVPGE